MRRILIFVLISPCLFLASSYVPLEENRAPDICRDMFKRTRAIKTVSYTMKKAERIDGELVVQIASVKLSRDPFKVYTKQKYPKDGLEVLYDPTQNDGKALINPNGFPWVNIKLDPLGSTMRDKQHHTVLESGYDHVVNILDFLMTKYEDEVNDLVIEKGETVWKNDTCWKIYFQNPHFKYEKHIVQEGETVLSIAKKTWLSEHMIMEKNKNVKDYGELEAGTEILVPNDYSPKMILFIDKKRNIPLVMSVYDDQGMYELYEYTDVVLDPTFKDEEFSRDYEDYGF